MNLKLKFHPAFWLFALTAVLNGDYIGFLASLASVLLHELAHAKSAYSRGYILDTVTLMPYGAMLKGCENISDKDGVPIAVSGPIANLAVCLCLYALWWAFPSAYVYTKRLCDVNFMLGAFNALPLYPLDGGRILLSITKNKTRTLKIMKITGITFAVCIFILYLASFFFKTNHTLGVMATLLFVSAVGGTEKETYKRLSENAPYLKNTDSVIEKETVMVHKDLKLVRLLSRIRADKKTTFEVVDDNLNSIKTLTEEDVNALCERYPLQCTIKELLSAYDARQDT